MFLARVVRRNVDVLDSAFTGVIASAGEKVHQALVVFVIEVAHWLDMLGGMAAGIKVGDRIERGEYLRFARKIGAHPFIGCAIARQTLPLRRYKGLESNK